MLIVKNCYKFHILVPNIYIHFHHLLCDLNHSKSFPSNCSLNPCRQSNRVGIIFLILLMKKQAQIM